jgi:hypothetical protein
MNILMWNYKADNRVINMAADEYRIWISIRPGFITSLQDSGHINPDGYSGKTGGNQISAKWMQNPWQLLKMGFSRHSIRHRGGDG